MNESERRRVLVRRLALCCAALVLAITSLSAFIRLSRAGLSCAEWPQCYGANLRQLQQGSPATAGEGEATAVARLAHRVVASAALLLVITMAVVGVTERPVRWREARVSLGLLALALALALLGRWSADARIPAVAIGNLIGGFAMLALCWRLARIGGATLPGSLRAWAMLGLALLAGQVWLGGLVSASFAATSCNAIFDCLAAARGVALSALDPWREPVLAGVPPVNASGALAQSLHRLAGIGIVALLVPLAIIAIRQGRRGAGAATLILLGAQAGLGLAMLGGGPTLALALAHNLAAALLCAAVLDLARGAGATSGA